MQFRPSRSLPLPLPGLLIALALCLAAPASAEWNGRYFLFDRALWSPDGKSVGIIGRFTNTKSGETLEDTLLVDATTGAAHCVSPSVLNFVLSRDGSRIMTLGRWGLYDYDVRTGVTREIRSIGPFQDREIQLFSYTRTMDGAIVIRCSEDYPESSGVYEYPLAGGPAKLLLSDPACANQSLNYWQSHRRDIEPMEYALPRYDKPTIVENFPGTLWQVKVGETPAVAIWGNGPVAADTLCRNCRVEFNSWPKNGGQILVSTSPEDIYDVLTPGDLWLAKPSRPSIHLSHGRFQKAAWVDSTLAYVLARPGVLLRVDAGGEQVRPVGQSMVPDWLRGASVPPLRVWTIRLADEIFAHPDSARARAVALREFGVPGFGMEPENEGTAYRLSVGSFPDSGKAVAAVAALRKEKRARVSGNLTVHAMPVSRMQGQFDFGALVSPDGRRQVYFKSHPHMFLPYLASEIWIRNLPDGRPKMSVGAMANF